MYIGWGLNSTGGTSECARGERGYHCRDNLPRKKKGKKKREREKMKQETRDTRRKIQNGGRKKGIGRGGEREREGDSLAPLLEETHPLTLAIGAPEITAAAGTVAAVLRPVIAVATASYASPPKQVYQRGTSTRD